MLKIYTFCPTDRFGCNTYIIGTDDEYAVIDPSVSYGEILESHPEIEGKVKYILLTHYHFDHILEIDSWYQICKDVRVGAQDKIGLSDPYINCYLGFLGTNEGFFGESQSLFDGDILTLGKEDIRIIACPGHTPGGVAYRIADNIFVGDTVFEQGGYGRCDLPLGDIEKLEKSIIRLLTHEKDAAIYPGHGGKTSIREITTYFI